MTKPLSRVLRRPKPEELPVPGVPMITDRPPEAVFAAARALARLMAAGQDRPRS